MKFRDKKQETLELINPKKTPEFIYPEELFVQTW